MAISWCFAWTSVLGSVLLTLGCVTSLSHQAGVGFKPQSVITAAMLTHGVVSEAQRRDLLAHWWPWVTGQRESLANFRVTSHQSKANNVYTQTNLAAAKTHLPSVLRDTFMLSSVGYDSFVFHGVWHASHRT